MRTSDITPEALAEAIGHLPSVHFIRHDERPPLCCNFPGCIYVRAPRDEDNFYAHDRTKDAS